MAHSFKPERNELTPPSKANINHVERAKSFKDRRTAEARLAEIEDKSITCFIHATASGRYVPVVVLRDNNSWMLHQLIARGIYVTN